MKRQMRICIRLLHRKNLNRKYVNDKILSFRIRVYYILIFFYKFDSDFSISIFSIRRKYILRGNLQYSLVCIYQSTSQSDF